jgi:hypothetical protein
VSRFDPPSKEAPYREGMDGDWDGYLDETGDW